MSPRYRPTDPRPVLLAVALSLTSACGTRPPAEPSAPAATVAARFAPAERLELPSRVDLVGTVEAEKTAAVSARVMARVTAVRVRAGESVARGQQLLDIDPQAAEGQLSQARGARAQALAALALAERNYERYKVLAEVEAASELELDLARTQYEQAAGAVEQAEGGVAAAASVAADSRVVAPFAGRIVRRMVEVGDLAAPGRPLLIMESGDDMRLALSVPESVMARAGLTIGDPIEVSIDSRPDLGTMTATVVEASPGADPASHSFQVKAALPPVDVASGASARARIEIGRRPAVAIPEAALLHRGGLTLVVLRDEAGRAASRVVTLGDALADGRIEVLSGLAGGETVAVGLAEAPPSGALLTPEAGS